MGVSQGRSRVADLSFQVFSRPLHPDFVAVRRHLRIAQGAWNADLRIIEGGHAICWRTGDTRVSEVLAGPETILPEPGLLFHSPVRRERAATLRQGEHAEYQTCFDVERVEPEIFRHLTAELMLDASRSGLAFQFSPANRLWPGSVSLMRVDARTTGLSVQVFHTFPDERAILRIQSLFEILSPSRSGGL
jgi:hypothetical protein